MDISQKARAYDEALERAKKELQTCGSIDCDAARQIIRLFPELTESKDEKIRKTIVSVLEQNIRAGFDHSNGFKFTEMIIWLEKQKDINSKEYVFRPLAGCDINTAAIQAVEQQKLGNKIVLAFNGAYIPVEGKTADDVVKEYDSWLEKQGEQKPIDYNKELKKCRENPLYFFDKYVKIKVQKPAWSKEDDKQLDIAMESCQFLNKIETVDWLKSLKQRLGG